jgi:hypothetical protein
VSADGSVEHGLRTGSTMPNNNRNRKNQPPTSQGKAQSRFQGEPRKLGKRSDVLQAQRDHPELNLGDTDEEAASAAGDRLNPKRPKAGR